MSPVGPQYGFGLYVHWPYCAKICPYCDFNVYAAKDRDTRPLVEAICHDIIRHKALLPDHPPLDSLFLGGGTPSLLQPAEIESILDTASDRFGFKLGAEITIEANPNDILRSDLQAWQAAGINRVSLGIQSLNDEALTFLGRDHDTDVAHAALNAVQARFDNHSIDLIYARPGQSIEAWQIELSAVLALGAPHLSLYELTIAERTAFGQRAARGDLIPMPDEAQADLYEITQSLCSDARLPAYEVSNHARGQAFQSVHNNIYWNSGDWIGVGPGAHGRLTIEGTRLATEAVKRPADYLSEDTGTSQQLTAEERALELMAMGLRPESGLDLSRYHALTGARPAAEVISRFTTSGHLRQIGSSIALTASGRLLADHIAGKLVS